MYIYVCVGCADWCVCVLLCCGVMVGVVNIVYTCIIIFWVCVDITNVSVYLCT